MIQTAFSQVNRGEVHAPRLFSFVTGKPQAVAQSCIFPLIRFPSCELMPEGKSHAQPVGVSARRPKPDSLAQRPFTRPLLRTAPALQVIGGLRCVFYPLGKSGKVGQSGSCPSSGKWNSIRRAIQSRGSKRRCVLPCHTSCPLEVYLPAKNATIWYPPLSRSFSPPTSFTRKQVSEFGIRSERRTSRHFLSFTEDPAIYAINRRIAAISNTAVEQGEPLQVLRYKTGQEYKLHHDALPGEANQRGLTVLIYLNADYSGGETVFSSNGLEVRGKAGDAILFRNVGEDGKPEPAARHAGRPVARGTKYIASRWVRRIPLDLGAPRY